MEANLYPRLYFYRRIVQAKLFIDAHYFEKIELHTLADEAYYSKFHFGRKFKEVYHKTPHQYLIFVRMEQAKRLLAQDIAVAAVGIAVGFEELGSFSRLFKRLVGITPSLYQKQQLAIKQQITEAPLTLIPHCFAFQYGWSEKSNFRQTESDL